MRTALSLVLGLVSLVACAPARYYEIASSPSDQPFRFDEKEERSRLLSELPEQLGRAGVRVLRARTPSSSLELVLPKPPALIAATATATATTASLAALPTPVLAALSQSAKKEARGAELDLLLHGEDGQRIPVTTRFEPDGTLDVRQGPPWPTADRTEGSAAASEQLRLRYGIGPTDDGEVPWTAPYLQALEQALSLLSQEERAFLSRIPIAREHSLKHARDPHRVQARYLRVGGVARIELYDSLLYADQTSFCGEPDAPRPTSVCILLHEIGHALADLVHTSALGELGTARSELVGQLDPLLARKAEQGASVQYTDEEVDGVLRSARRLQVKYARAARLDENGPAVQAYRRARSQRKGPTPYGSVSPHESFAEAFALFRADPAALRRIDEGAYYFFLREGHLHALGED